MVNRKRFLHLSAAGAAGLLLPDFMTGAQNNAIFSANSLNDRLADAAVAAARAQGAAYADVRIARSRTGLFNEAGIRTLVNGHWGYARTFEMSEQGIAECVADAIANAAKRSPRHQYDLKVKHELWRCAFLKQS